MNATPFMQQRLGPYWGAIFWLLIVPWSLVALVVWAIWRALH